MMRYLILPGSKPTRYRSQVFLTTGLTTVAGGLTANLLASPECALSKLAGLLTVITAILNFSFQPQRKAAFCHHVVIRCSFTLPSSPISMLAC